MVALFNTILFEPIFNLLMWIYQYLPPHDLGLSIILVTLILKLILFLPSWSSIRSQQVMQDIQPKLDALRKKYENNREEYSRQLLLFYRENKINPLSSCLPLLIQFPILIALYQVFRAVSQAGANGLLPGVQLDHLYAPLRAIFMEAPIHSTLFGLVDLNAKSIVIAAIAAALQFWQTRMMMRRKPAAQPTAKPAGGNMAQTMTRQMMYTMPVITLIFGASVPAGVTLYWAVSTVFQIAQQYFFFRARQRRTNDAQPQAAA